MCFTRWTVFVHFLPSSRIGKGKSVPGMLPRWKTFQLSLTRMKIVCLTHYSKLKSLSSWNPWKVNLKCASQNSRKKKKSWWGIHSLAFLISLPFPVMFRTDFFISKLILLLKISMKKDLLNVFWCSMYQSHPKVSEAALRLLLPFSTTLWCESSFSTLLQIKNKSRNRLDVDPDMRCALSVPQPRIRRLTEKYDVSLLIGVW